MRTTKRTTAKSGRIDTETARRLAALRAKILDAVLVLLARFPLGPAIMPPREKRMRQHLLRQHLLREAADRVGLWTVCDRSACRRAQCCRRHAGECLVTLAQTLRANSEDGAR